MALDPEALDNIANDPYMVQLFNTAGDAKIRLTLDGSGNPVFLLEDGTQIQGVDAPEVVKQLPLITQHLVTYSTFLQKVLKST